VRIVPLKLNSFYVRNNSSKKITPPEYVKLGTTSFRSGIKVTMLHGKQLATIDRVVRAYAAKKGLKVTLAPSCTAENIDFLLKNSAAPP